MRCWTRTALALCISGSLTACGGGGNDGSGGEGDIAELPAPPPVETVPPEESGITNTSLPLYEDFGSYTGFDQSDTIDFFSPGHKALATDNDTDPRPAFYYPTCCFFDNDDPNAEITVDHKERLGIISDDGDPSLLVSNARFSIGQTLSEMADADAKDPKKDSTPGTDGGSGWGELDLSKPYRISFCVAAAGGSGSSTQIYVNNNSTSEANSIHGGGSTGSRIFNVPTDSLVPGQRVEINVPGDTTLQSGGEVVDLKTEVIGTANSFLQLRVSSGGSAIIDDLLIEYQDENGQADLPACTSFTPATPPDAPEAPALFASDGQISASWSRPIGASSFDLAYNTIDDPDTATVIAGIEDTSTTLDELENGTEYFVFLRVTNSAGTGDWSQAASATPEAPVGDNCVPTTTVDPSPTNAILWNVYDGCMAPGELGSVVINGSSPTNFDLAEEETPYFSVSELGIMTLDTIGTDAKPVGDLVDIIAGDNATYPKHFTWIARIDTSAAASQSGVRGFEVETDFGDSNQRRVKAVLRPDGGKIQLEKFLPGDATAEVDMAMDGGFHIYQVAFTVQDPASVAENISATIYRDGVEAGSFTGDGRDGGSAGSMLRVGEGSTSSEFYADVDWLIWSDSATAAGLTPEQLAGELPAGIGELGSYTDPDAVTGPSAWNVYNADVTPTTSGAVTRADSGSGEFTANGDVDFFSANGDGTVSFDSTDESAGSKGYADYEGITNAAGSYPKTFTYLAGVSGNNTNRALEIEASFGDQGGSGDVDGGRVKLIIRSDDPNRIQLDNFVDSNELEVEVPTFGYHIYHVVVTLTAPRQGSVDIYMDGNDTPVLSGETLSGELLNSAGAGTNRLRIGDNSGSNPYVSDVDWLIWTDEGAYTPSDLKGNLPDGLGQLGAYE